MPTEALLAIGGCVLFGTVLAVIHLAVKVTALEDQMEGKADHE